MWWGGEGSGQLDGGMGERGVCGEREGGERKR